jgi:4-amino-4-deoxy-L-arabinose transferase-like glycosyltransferase
MTALTETQPTGAPEPEHRAAPAGSAPRFGLPPQTWREILLVLLLIFCYGFFQQDAYWNEYSRYDLTVALVDDHTTRIDPYQQNTGDKAFYNGHYYSDKPPGSALLGMPVYLLLRATAQVVGNAPPDPARVIQALAFFICGLSTALLALLLLRFLRAYVEEWWALTITLGYALGTLAFPFATMFFGHAPAAFFLFAAFYILWRSERGGPAWYPAWAGFLAGWAVLTDISVILGVAFLLLYAFAGNRRRPLLVIAGALPVALALGGYNLLSFGSPLRLGYGNLASQGFQEAMNKGIFGVTLPTKKALSTIIFGPRGLIILAPWLTLAPLGLVALRARAMRRELAACGVIVLAFVLFNAGYFLPIGGASPGPRFLVPALPFAAVLAAFVPLVFRSVLLLELVYSVAIQTLITVTSPFTPENLTAPLSQLWFPRLVGHVLAPNFGWLRWGLSGLVPLFVLLAVAALGAAGLAATARRTTAARGLVVTSTAILAVAILLLSTPLDLPNGLGIGRAAAAAPANIVILAAGTLNLPVEQGPPQIMCWAQVANRGGAVQHTRVKFSVYTPDGQMTWGGWVADVAWAPGQRRQATITWTRQNVAPGNYRLSITVISDDQQTVYAEDENAATVEIQP